MAKKEAKLEVVDEEEINKNEEEMTEEIEEDKEAKKQNEKEKESEEEKEEVSTLDAILANHEDF